MQIYIYNSANSIAMNIISYLQENRTMVDPIIRRDCEVRNVFESSELEQR